MFSLIITIISIVLVTALALATIYYGGTAFKDGTAKAAGAQVVLQGQQISAAVDIYRATNAGNLPASMGDLTLNRQYLTSAPDSSWIFGTDYVVYPMTDLAACLKANAAIGITLSTIPLCSAVTGQTICCQAS